MRKTLTLLVFLLVCTHAFGQDWNPLDNGLRHYFTNSIGYLKMSAIDSVASYGGDLHYYPYLRHKYNADGLPISTVGPYPDTIGSWLGRYIIRKPGGDYLFINHWSDTITIKTLASPGQSWIFHRESNYKYYTAEVTSVDTMTILGVPDSVKRIVLHAYDNGNLVTSDSFNNTEIVLSKNTGFQRIMELYYFPFHEPDTSLAVSDYYIYASMTLPIMNLAIPLTLGQQAAMFELIDFHSPAESEMINWNVGDAYLYHACSISLATGQGYCDPGYNYRFDSVVSKTYINSGVEYVLKGWTAHAVYPIGSNIISYYNVFPYQDTVIFSDTVSYLPGMVMPEKLIYNGGFWDVPNLYYFLPVDTAFCAPSPTYYRWDYYFSGLSAAASYEQYGLGTGLFNSNSLLYDNVMVEGFEYLIYSKRNGVPCGNYIFPDTAAPVVNSVSSINEDAFKIYPNPASGELRIEASTASYNIELLNSIGQLIFKKGGYRDKQTIDLSAYTEGIYILRLTTASGNRFDKKIIIQH